VSRRRLGEDPEESDGGGERDQASEAGDKETALFLASREGEIRDVTAASEEGQAVREIQERAAASWEPGWLAVNCLEGKWVAMLTPTGIRHFGMRASSKFLQTYMSR
jgi:hypothetical protein